MIRAVTTNDAAAIGEIYNHYVANSIITFEEKVPSPFDIESFHNP
jgi:L-amino acid N-acyltransferase YncA